MLVLTRQRSEEVVITCSCGNCTRLAVVDIRGDKVRLGFSAPREVQIVRDDAHNKQPRAHAKVASSPQDKSSVLNPAEGANNIVPAEKAAG